MLKTFVGVLFVLGLSAGAFWFANPDLAKKTLDENKSAVEKIVDDLKKKAE